MKMLVYGLAVVCAIIAVIYFVLPGGSLPKFLPGYVAGSTHVHKMHGFAAVTGAVVFLLIGLSTRRKRP
jgi:thiosulfate reductase cytochrome b subunit